MKWSTEEIKYLKNNYNKLSVSQLSKKLGRSAHSIYYKASKLKISRQEYNREFMRGKSRRYSLDENYFDKIDTEDKAYFLGLMFADGYNYEIKNHISISLHEKDVDVLKKFNEHIKNERPLFYKVDKREDRSCNSYLMSFSSVNISKKLAKYGCSQNKTFTIKFPNISENLKKHFIRGYFDGDGGISIYVAKSGKYESAQIRASFTSNEKFIQDLMDNIPNHLTGKSTYIVKDKRHDDVHYLFMSGHARVINFLSYIYDNSSVYMNRKMNRYMAIKKCISNGLKGRRLIEEIQKTEKEW